MVAGDAVFVGRYTGPGVGSAVVEVHTSGRIKFKRCRRSWFLTDAGTRNLEAVDASSFPLWFGSGFHFAMEDLHGYNRWGSPLEAFKAYHSCFRRSELPDEADEGVELAKGMFEYYQDLWRPKHPEFSTLWLNGEPQVEVIFVLDLPTWDHTTGEVICNGFDPDPDQVVRQDEDVVCTKCRLLEKVHNSYAGRFDRIAVDEHGRWWVEDYKTAQRFDTTKLPTDPQVTSYTWAAQQMYGAPFEGVVYTQFLKEVPHDPLELQNGGFSLNKKQATTYEKYKAALLKEYGVESPETGVLSVPRWVIEHYGDILRTLKAQETPEGDKFIRRDLVYRNAHQSQSEYQKILQETYDMTNPSLAMYPNPTKDCVWDCSVRQVCIAMDDGSDWEAIIAANFIPRSSEWRERLIWPRERLALPEDLQHDQEQNEALMSSLRISETL